MIIEITPEERSEKVCVAISRVFKTPRGKVIVSADKYVSIYELRKNTGEVARTYDYAEKKFRYWTRSE